MVDHNVGQTTGSGVRSRILADDRDRAIIPEGSHLLRPLPSTSIDSAPTPIRSPYRDRQLVDQPAPWGEVRTRRATRSLPDRWAPTYYVVLSFIAVLVPALLIDNLPQAYYLLLGSLSLLLNYSLLLPIVHRIKQ